MLRWLRRRQEARRLAQADARDHGAETYAEARERERDVILPDGAPAHWRRADDGQEGRRRHGDPNAGMKEIRCASRLLWRKRLDARQKRLICSRRVSP